MHRELQALVWASFLIGLSIVALISLARAIAPTKLLMRRPLSCDLCSSFWVSIALTAFLVWYTGSQIGLEPALPAMVIATYLLPRIAPPPTRPPPEP